VCSVRGELSLVVLTFMICDSKLSCLILNRDLVRIIYVGPIWVKCL